MSRAKLGHHAGKVRARAEYVASRVILLLQKNEDGLLRSKITSRLQTTAKADLVNAVLLMMVNRKQLAEVPTNRKRRGRPGLLYVLVSARPNVTYVLGEASVPVGEPDDAVHDGEEGKEACDGVHAGPDGDPPVVVPQCDAT